MADIKLSDNYEQKLIENGRGDMNQLGKRLHHRLCTFHSQVQCSTYHCMIFVKLGAADTSCLFSSLVQAKVHVLLLPIGSIRYHEPTLES